MIFLLSLSLLLPTTIAAADECGERQNKCFGINWRWADLDDIHGIDVLARDWLDLTPLHWATRSNNPQIIQTLLAAGAEVNAKTARQRTPLHMASWHNYNHQMAQVLLAAGAEVNVADIGGYTPLHWASEQGNFETVLALLNAGADTEAENRGGMTPLHAAAWRATDSSIFLALLSKGAKIDARKKGGMTPLHLASWHNKAPRIIPLLINAGADISARDNGGFTPLLLAALRSKHPQNILALLDAGSNPKDQNAQGENAYQLMHFNEELADTDIHEKLRELVE